ncbi:MAG TPA: alcohol dehydrogenase [Chloroflexi bacterium]|nr:alcohol dehydrogenase [Chloroflexota bacterium]
MKAAVYEQFQQPLAIQTVPDPAPDPDGVIIEVKANGICRSDWHGWMGHDPDIHLPHVPGHELAGVVAAVGRDVQLWQPGDRVTVPFACGCGRCPQCQSGNQQICDNYFQPGFTAWGAFAQYVHVKYADVNLVRLPESIGFVEAASLGCRFITAFRGMAAQGRVSAGEWVAVYGCGGVGLSAIMIAAALGANVIGVDINEAALEMARNVGATAVFNPRQTDVVSAIHDLTHGGAHVSIDALGSRETCANSIRSLRKRGRHIQVGLLAGPEADPPIPMSLVIGRELEILGSHGMQAHEYGRLLDMISAGTLRPRQLIRQTVSLSEAADFLPRMNQFNHVGVTVIDRFDDHI